MKTTLTLEQVLAELSTWHLWVVEYGISHGRTMKLVLHHGNYMSGYTLTAVECARFSGDLEGGPYELIVEQRERETFGGKRSPTETRLTDRRGLLELVCESVLVAPRGATAEATHS